MKSITLLLALSLLGCEALTGGAKRVDVPVPVGCADGLDVIADAVEAIATASGEEELRARLAEIAKHYDRETIACAVDLFVLQRGGLDKLTDNERLAYDIVTAYLERRE